MRQLLLAIVMGIGFAVPTEGATILWTAILDSSQEIPPNASQGSGTGTIEFDDATNVLALSLTWQDLTGNGVQSHIHCCVTSPPGNVGIALDLWLIGTPQPPSGTYQRFYDLDVENPFRAAFVAANGGTTLSAFDALAAAMNADEGRAYFNIHTNLFPGGEIRGNIEPDSVPVPEPTTLMLLLPGIAALRLRRRLLVDRR
jgi:hypothetical protein